MQEENKNLINASVLGLIFEKINGYKDGSFFTPGVITMYMCRETIRRAVVQKFNAVIWNSFILGVLSFVLEIVIAVPLGILAARKQYSRTDYAVTIFALIALSRFRRTLD